MGLVQVAVTDQNGIGIPGVVCKLLVLDSPYLGGPSVWTLKDANTTGITGGVPLDTHMVACTGIESFKVQATYYGVTQEKQGHLAAWSCAGSALFTFNVSGGPNMSGPIFAITEWWIHEVDCVNPSIAIKSYDVLAGQQPVIPPYDVLKCGPSVHNFVSVVKARNVDTVQRDVKYRVQICPSSQGGQPMGGPFPIPPCGNVVDSGVTTSFAPGEEKYLPVWELQMWSENIRLHNWIIDASTQQVFNCGVCYVANNWCLQPDIGYRADDWFVDIAISGGQAGQGLNWLIPVSIGAFILVIVGAEVSRRRRK